MNFSQEQRDAALQATKLKQFAKVEVCCSWKESTCMLTTQQDVAAQVLCFAMSKTVTGTNAVIDAGLLLWITRHFTYKRVMKYAPASDDGGEYIWFYSVPQYIYFDNFRIKMQFPEQLKVTQSTSGLPLLFFSSSTSPFAKYNQVSGDSKVLAAPETTSCVASYVGRRSQKYLLDDLIKI
jgi:hypothetical protein